MTPKILCSVVLVLALLAPVRAADPAPAQAPAATAPAPLNLKRFNLDFPGGTPGELVAAIQNSTGRPLNVVIPTTYAKHRLPPLKMANVNVAELFKALQLAQVTEYVGGMHVTSIPLFHSSSAAVTDDTVWSFMVGGTPGPVQRDVRFYLLTPYLEAGISVDDITTAVQTAWKLTGDAELPSLSFHQDTKLLIGAGLPNRLDAIDRVLRALDPVRTPAKRDPMETQKKE